METLVNPNGLTKSSPVGDSLDTILIPLAERLADLAAQINQQAFQLGQLTEQLRKLNEQ